MHATSFTRFFVSRAGKWMDLSNDILFEESTFNPIAANLNGQLSSLLGEYQRDRYSRKVFVGGLPPDIDEGRE